MARLSSTIRMRLFCLAMVSVTATLPGFFWRSDNLSASCQDSPLLSAETRKNLRARTLPRAGSHRSFFMKSNQRRSGQNVRARHLVALRLDGDLLDHITRGEGWRGRGVRRANRQLAPRAV